MDRDTGRETGKADKAHGIHLVHSAGIQTPPAVRDAPSGLGSAVSDTVPRVLATVRTFLIAAAWTIGVWVGLLWVWSVTR